MVSKELDVTLRINSANGQMNFAIPKKKLSTEELDSIQKKGIIKIIMKDL